MKEESKTNDEKVAAILSAGPEVELNDLIRGLNTMAPSYSAQWNRLR